jgi:hypothetical protein
MINQVLITALLLGASGIAAYSSAQSNTKPFSLTLVTKEPTVKGGTSIWVTVELKNNSDQDIEESGSINAMTGADPNLIFDIRDESGNVKQKKAHQHPQLASGKPFNRTIHPGETFEKEQDVSRLFDMTGPGKYVIQVYRRATDDGRGAIVKSNTITITVTPPDTPTGQ